MASDLEEILKAKFDELNVPSTRIAWAKYLDGLDQGTLSRILNGSMPLTLARAKKWAGLLWPEDAAASAQQSQEMFTAAQQGTPAPSVSDFFEDMFARRGVVPAERISELLKALQAPELEKVLICCEYRDLPRASPDSRYEELAGVLGQAIAEKVHFAMFQPFGEEIPLSKKAKAETPASAAAHYMESVRIECINGYEAFRAAAMYMGATSSVVLNRLNLYQRKGSGYLGSGLQAKIFYIRYSTKNGEGTSKRHERIMQWLSTPKSDVLVYRGQKEITGEALRASFYPIAHFFDAEGRLPGKSDNAHEVVKAKPGAEGLPDSYDIWQAYA